MSIRKWLRENNYQFVDDKIAQVEAMHKASGSKERRNWADVLSGGKDGSPITVAGVEFPVLAAAQRSRGKAVTNNAIELNKGEEFPPARVTGRWPKRRRLPAKAKRPTRAKTTKPRDARAS